MTSFNCQSDKILFESILLEYVTIELGRLSDKGSSPNQMKGKDQLCIINLSGMTKPLFVCLE